MAFELLVQAGMTTNFSILPLADLDHVSGGATAAASAGASPDPTAALTRAAGQKTPNGLDLYGYAQTGSTGVGAEYRRKISPNTSLFVNGHVGTKAGQPDDAVMGGVRFEW